MAIEELQILHIYNISFGNFNISCSFLAIYIASKKKTLVYGGFQLP
jgi:hypothetical protein